MQALRGAKAHLVVIPDADLDAAADAWCRRRTNTRSAMLAVTVAVAVSAADARWWTRLPTAQERSGVGDGAASGIDMGPLISAGALDRVRAALERSVEQGGRLIVDGRDRPAAG